MKQRWRHRLFDGLWIEPTPERCAGRRSVVDLSCDQTILEHLEEDAARAHWHAILVAPIKTPMLPAAVTAVEVLKEAVPGATRWVCLNRAAAVLLE